MKRLFCCIAIVLILMGLSGCVTSDYHPESGIWYCDELHLELNFDTLEGELHISEDKSIPVNISTAPNTLISYIEDGMIRGVYEGHFKPYTDDEFIFEVNSVQSPILANQGNDILMEQEFIFHLVEGTEQPIGDSGSDGVSP